MLTYCCKFCVQSWMYTHVYLALESTHCSTLNEFWPLKFKLISVRFYSINLFKNWIKINGHSICNILLSWNNSAIIPILYDLQGLRLTLQNNIHFLATNFPNQKDTWQLLWRRNMEAVWQKSDFLILQKSYPDTRGFYCFQNSVLCCIINNTADLDFGLNVERSSKIRVWEVFQW